MVVQLDDIDSFWTYETDITDNILPVIIFDAISKIDFKLKLHPKIIENSKGYPKKLDQKTMEL